MDCPFCKIDEKRRQILKDSPLVRVIVSNPGLMEGHILVIPKRHVEKLAELTSVERKELFDTIIEFEEIILKNISSGCDIRQNYRPFQKQGRLKVNHLHFHLQPREFKDELYKKCQIFEKELFKDLNSDEIKKISNLFFK